MVATRDTLVYGKPDVRAFHHACRLLESAPTETIYVGDHLEIDAIAARRPWLRSRRSRDGHRRRWSRLGPTRGVGRHGGTPGRLACHRPGCPWWPPSQPGVDEGVIDVKQQRCAHQPPGISE